MQLAQMFVPRHSRSEKICTMTAKTTPRIRSLRPYEMSDPHPLPAYGLRSTQRRLLMLTAGPLANKANARHLHLPIPYFFSTLKNPAQSLRSKLATRSGAVNKTTIIDQI